MSYTIGIDMGGTKTAAGLAGEDGRILARAERGTCPPRAAGEYADILAETAKELVEKAGVSWEEILWTGVGLPGTVNLKEGALEYANNLGITYAPMKEMLEQRLPGRIYLENDGNAAAWAEYLYGAGKGSRNFLMVTLGTGIGAGFILDGKIDRGVNYAMGEVGHMTIHFEGEPCACGRRGCFEQYASASALIRQAKECMRLDLERNSLLWKLSEGDREKVNGKVLFEAVRRQDPAAQEVLARYLVYLECGITSLINIFQPEVLCIGGGISQAEDCILEPLRERAAKMVYSRASKRQTKIVAAQLYNDAGILGAALLGREAGREEQER